MNPAATGEVVWPTFTRQTWEQATKRLWEEVYEMSPCEALEIGKLVTGAEVWCWSNLPFKKLREFHGRLFLLAMLVRCEAEDGDRPSRII